MRADGPRRLALAALLRLALAASPPQIELGVGWAPTPIEGTARALEWARVGPDDVFYELGCGDGRVAIAAARRGARVVCVEADAAMLRRAARDAAAAGLAERIEMVRADVMHTPLHNATVVFMFLVPSMTFRLRLALEQMAPRARVISRESQIYGWPCGERLSMPGFLFFKWELPVTPDEEHTNFDEEGAVNHLLECAADDAVRTSVERGSVDPAVSHDESGAVEDRLLALAVDPLAASATSMDDVQPPRPIRTDLRG
ncbi:hypothetical protein AB1Y20_010392 [Prymnesium parvum]|uniref:Methyltransferase domain-containing protein n=1 Tax=Prymnesium parvum TaxID=97485 RepID=A0AB34INH9_PRYPA